MKKHSDYEFIIAIRFWALCLILAPIILLLPLSRWVALVWMGGFIGGALRRLLL